MAITLAEAEIADVLTYERLIPAIPLCQRSCHPNRIGTSGGADIRKWLDTDKRIRTG
jgi:hypothetical protein